MGLTMAGLALTLTDRSILGFLLMANEVYVCGVVGPVFAGLLLARRPARSPSLAAAGVLLGGGLGLASSLLEAPFLSYAGIALSLLLALRALEPLPALFALRRGESRGL
jgi:SSS family solute:Na+ symporter